MKKIFTLLFSVAMLSTAFAQYSQNGSRDKDKHDEVYVSNGNQGYDKYDKGYERNRKGMYIFTARERDLEIARIEHEYDHRIEAVQKNYRMGGYQKKNLLNDLLAQRDNEIHEVVHRFNDSRNQCEDRNRRGKRKRW